LGTVSAYFGKNISFRFHDSNNPAHSKVPCDDPDECAGDNGSKDKTQTAKQIQHFAGPLVEAVSQPTFIGGQIYVIKGLSLTEHYRFLMETTECFKCTSLSFDSYAALRYRFCCMTIAMGLRLLKMKCTNLNEQ